MFRPALATAALAACVLLRAVDADALLRDAAAAEARFDTKAALALYLQADAARPDQGATLQKIARQYSDLEFDAEDVNEKKRLAALALDYSRRAVAVETRNAVNLLSLAISYGKLASHADTRTKIEYSRLVKQYAEQALALDANCDYALHVLGRWHHEVAALGAGTRLLVAVIYGGLPAASTAEAVRLLRRAVELAPLLPSHRVELGLALLADGQRAEARATLAEALALPPREKHDDDARARARAALARLAE